MGRLVEWIKRFAEVERSGAFGRMRTRDRTMALIRLVVLLAGLLACIISWLILGR